MYNCSFDNNLWEYDGDATSCFGILDKPVYGGETRRINVCNNRFNVRSSGPTSVYFINIGGAAWNISNNRGLWVSTNNTVASARLLRIEEGVDPATGDDADVPNQVSGNYVIHSCPNGVAANAYVAGVVALGSQQPLADLVLGDNLIQSDCADGSGTDKRIDATDTGANGCVFTIQKNGLGGLMDVADDLSNVTVVDNDATLAIADGVAIPDAIVGRAFIYVDTNDGDLKVKFGDGQVKTLATDTP